MEHPGRAAFRRVLHRKRGTVDLIEGALAIAQEDLDLPTVDETRASLERLAARAQEQVGPLEAPLDYAERLVNYLHGMEGFTGDRTTYDDPANSYLPVVCERRIGLPITLTLILLHVAWNNGVPLEPAGLPAHFMARWPLPEGDLFLDLFWGQVLDARGCHIFLQNQTGSAMPAPDLFPATAPDEVLARMLRNLKNSYVRRSQWQEALQATERILLLLPQSWDDVRDRGALRIRVGDYHRGLYDLDRYADEYPQAAQQALLRKQALAVSSHFNGRN